MFLVVVLVVEKLDLIICFFNFSEFGIVLICLFISQFFIVFSSIPVCFNENLIMELTMPNI
jgi:hypothetical protein